MTIIVMIYERGQVQGRKDKNESPSAQHRVSPLQEGTGHNSNKSSGGGCDGVVVLPLVILIFK